MSDEPMFNYFKGRGKLQIVPANGKGWLALVLFVLILLLPLPLVILFAEEQPWVVALPLLWILPMTFLFVRWAKPRSDVIDLDATGKDWQEYKRWKEEQRRRGR